MGKVNLVIPTATTNMITNPSGEGIGGYGASTGWTGVGTMLSASTLQAYLGGNSIQASLGALVGDGLYYTVDLVTGTTYTFSVYVLCVTGDLNVWFGSVAGAVLATVKVTAPNTSWVRSELSWTETGGGTVTRRLYITLANAGANTISIDAAQCEALAYATTYCDGDQPGCEWNGAPHASTSTRSAQSRAGGRVIDLDTYSITVDTLAGLGFPPHKQQARSYAIQPGGYLQGVKIQPRVITLACVTETASETAQYAALTALENALKVDAVATLQPIILQYDGNGTMVESECYYDTGLEGNLISTCYGRFILRLISYDPFWYGPGEHATTLDTNDALTMRATTARLRATGQWDDLGPPNAAGTYTSLLAIAVGPDGMVYMGGGFQNYDNIPAADRIVSYNPATGAYAALGTGMNGTVRALVVDAAGNLYAGGDFTSAGGVANTEYLARWDGANWFAVGGAVGGAPVSVDALAISPYNGYLYIAGSFTNWKGLGGAYDYLVYWDGANFFPVGDPGAGYGVGKPVAVVCRNDGDVFVGGNFTNWAGAADADYLAGWDAVTAAWYGVGTASILSGGVWALALGQDGKLYAGGAFTNAGGANGDYIACWNWGAWENLGSGLSAACNALAVGPDGVLYAGGTFTTAGGLTVTHVARWNGFAWATFDGDIPGVDYIYALAVGRADPVIKQNYNLWVGGDFGAATAAAGSVNVTNAGTATAYPRVQFYRTGGTSATLRSLRNETTGQELLFNLPLFAGETIILDLRPGAKTLTSSSRGNVLWALMPKSDLATWGLQPGVNQITCFINVAGAPSCRATMMYRDTYWAVENAV